MTLLSPDPESSPVNTAQLRRRLQQSGLSLLGVEQVLSGGAVTNPDDRALVTRLLVRALTASGGTAADRIYAWNKAQELRSG
jgi:hypothetical protein